MAVDKTCSVDNNRGVWMDLPNELICCILWLSGSSWSQRFVLLSVCRNWREIVCQLAWEDLLVIDSILCVHWPPFHGVSSLCFKNDMFDASALPTIAKCYPNVTALDFSIFSSVPPPLDQLDNFFDTISEFEKLDTFSLGNGNLPRWMESKHVGKLNRLSSVDISDCIHLKNDALLFLSNSKHLNISLRQSNEKEDKLTNQGMAALSGLRSLNISRRRKFDDNGLSYLRSIECLTMDGCKVTGSGFANLDRLTSLSYQKSACRVDLSHLVSMKNLKCVSLSGTIGICNDSLRHLRHVKILNISYCNGFSGIGISHLEKIEELDVSKCPQLVDNSFRNLSQSLSSLKVSGDDKLSDHIFNVTTHIHFLDVTFCSGITQQGVEQGRENCQYRKIQSDYDCVIKISGN